MVNIKIFQKGDTIQGDKYKKQGLEAQRYKQEEAERKYQEAQQTKEMRPVVVKKASLPEKLAGKKDSVTYMPHVIGMSGTDPIGEFIVGGIAANGLLKGATWLGKKAISKGATALANKAIVNKGSQQIDDLFEYIARQKQYAEQMQRNGNPLPPGFLEKLKELEQNVYAKQMEEMTIGPVIATENLPKILGPMYDDLAKGSHTVLHGGPYIETAIGDKNVIPIGIIKPGTYSKYRADRIVKGLKEKGIDVDEPGFYQGRGQKVVGSPRKIVQDLTDKPATLYISRTPNTTGGFYNVSSGKALVKIKPNSKPQNVRLTEVHENVSHATDDFLEAFPETTKDYKELATAIEKFGTKEKGSSRWYELRATLMEAHKKLADAVRKPIKGSYEAVDDYVNTGIDRMPYQTLAETLEGINDYGVDYARYIRANPFETNKFKHLLKHGLIWGTPIGMGATIGYGKSE